MNAKNLWTNMELVVGEASFKVLPDIIDDLDSNYYFLTERKHMAEARLKFIQLQIDFIREAREHLRKVYNESE